MPEPSNRSRQQLIQFPPKRTPNARPPFGTWAMPVKPAGPDLGLDSVDFRGHHHADRKPLPHPTDGTPNWKTGRRRSATFPRPARSQDRRKTANAPAPPRRRLTGAVMRLRAASNLRRRAWRASGPTGAVAPGADLRGTGGPSIRLACSFRPAFPFRRFRARLGRPASARRRPDPIPDLLRLPATSTTSVWRSFRRVALRLATCSSSTLHPRLDAVRADHALRHPGFWHALSAAARPAGVLPTSAADMDFEQRLPLAGPRGPTSAPGPADRSGRRCAAYFPAADGVFAAT